MNILILEDNAERIKWFVEKLSSHSTKFVTTADDAIAWIRKKKFDLIFLDHDLDGKTYQESGPGTGFEVAQAIPETENKVTKVIIHSWNTVGAAEMKKLLPEGTVAPFGTFSIDI